MTAALALRGTEIIAGVVGDLWNETVYGIDAEGLYSYSLRVGHHNRQTIQLAGSRRGTILASAAVAAYAPYHRLMKLLYPGLFENALIVANNAGIGTQLAVVEMTAQHAVAASIETKPIDLFEHIGAVLACRAGAYVCRMDGSEFITDPRHLQTSITAVSKDLADEIWSSIRDQYKAAGMPPRRHPRYARGNGVPEIVRRFAAVREFLRFLNWRKFPRQLGVSLEFGPDSLAHHLAQIEYHRVGDPVVSPRPILA